MMLSESVRVARRFQRSIRMDSDLRAADALAGFICQGTSQLALESMSGQILESGQRAFTWTGPYGCGKSSLALALAVAVGGDSAQVRHARDLLGNVANLSQAFPSSGNDWLVVPVVGRRGDPVRDVRDAVHAAVTAADGPARTRRRRVDPSGRDVITRLQDEAEARTKGGVLLVLDEMGKFLENASVDGSDIYFFQELAEAASRCEGRLVVLGILHQAFEQYASQQGRDIQDEWAKIQGRFVDIPIVTAIDEVIDLIGQAMVKDCTHAGSAEIATIVATAIRRRRPGSPDDLPSRLDACWPLHPVTAALLGPISRHRFGQNERSTFAFLASSEPEGFQEFLRGTPHDSGVLFDPARMWDYLNINLGFAILSSPDGHRWAQGAEAVERCEAKGSPMHIRLAKTIALIDLFRNGSGLMAERHVLHASLFEIPAVEVDAALRDLETWSIAVFRKHLDAWAIYAGSDFDIVGAVEEEMATASDLDLERLGRLADLQPLLAKEHYHRTGTLRWFETALVGLDDAAGAVKSFKPRDGAAGKFLLAIPDGKRAGQTAQETCRRASECAADYPLAVGLPPNSDAVHTLAKELIALEAVRISRPELEGDQVARREISARIAIVSAELEELLRASVNSATWYVRGEAHVGGHVRALQKLLAKLVDDTFPDAPVVHSELVNREKPSSNSQAAVRALLHAMVSAPREAYLGIEGYPAERGLYSTVLEAARLHGRFRGTLAFKAPTARAKVGRSFLPMWKAAKAFVEVAEEPVSLTSLYDLWAAPPFGIRRGVLPILAMSFMLAQERSIAVYLNGTFQPDMNDFLADCLLQNADQISLRFVGLRVEDEHFLKELTTLAGALSGTTPAPEPLAVARSLVEFAFRLPDWTRRTHSLSPSALNVRRVLLNASDPYAALFIDLPRSVGGTPSMKTLAQLAVVLQELQAAYPTMLDDLRRRMLRSLGHKGDDLERLRERARVVVGVAGDLQLEAFVTRLMEFSGRREDIEAIASLVIHKPARDWSDMEPRQAAFELAEHALRFRQAEALVRVQNRIPTQHAFAVVFGTDEASREVMKRFEVASSDLDDVTGLANRIVEMARATGLDREVLLAAMAEAGLQMADDSDCKSAVFELEGAPQ